MTNHKLTDEDLDKLLSSSNLSMNNPEFNDSVFRRIQDIKVIQNAKPKSYNHVSIISYSIGILTGLVLANLLYQSGEEFLGLKPIGLYSIMTIGLLLVGKQVFQLFKQKI